MFGLICLSSEHGALAGVNDACMVMRAHIEDNLHVFVIILIGPPLACKPCK